MCANCSLVVSMNTVQNACSNSFYNLSLLRGMRLTVVVTLFVKSVSCSSIQSFTLGPLIKCKVVTTSLKRFCILTCSSLIVQYNSHCCMNVSASALFLVNVSGGVPFIRPISRVLVLVLLRPAAIVAVVVAAVADMPLQLGWVADKTVRDFVQLMVVVLIHWVQIVLLVQ